MDVIVLLIIIMVLYNNRILFTLQFLRGRTLGGSSHHATSTFVELIMLFLLFSAVIVTSALLACILSEWSIYNETISPLSLYIDPWEVRRKRSFQNRGQRSRVHILRNVGRSKGPCIPCAHPAWPKNSFSLVVDGHKSLTIHPIFPTTYLKSSEVSDNTVIMGSSTSFFKYTTDAASSSRLQRISKNNSPHGIETTTDITSWKMKISDNKGVVFSWYNDIIWM